MNHCVFMSPAYIVQDVYVAGTGYVVKKEQLCFVT